MLPADALLQPVLDTSCCTVLDTGMTLARAIFLQVHRQDKKTFSNIFLMNFRLRQEQPKTGKSSEDTAGA